MTRNPNRPLEKYYETTREWKLKGHLQSDIKVEEEEEVSARESSKRSYDFRLKR